MRDKTYKMVRKLKRTGFSEAQAATIIEAQIAVSERFATRDDLKEVQHQLEKKLTQHESEFVKLRSDFKTSIAELKCDIHRLMFTCIGFMASAIVIVKFIE